MPLSLTALRTPVALQVGCNCIGAFYLSSMPAIDVDGRRAAGDDSYCDAPGANGYPCPELDLVEANRFTLATTLHGCLPYEGAPDRWRRHADGTYSDGAYHGACDDWGCAASTRSLPAGSYGPGRGNTIDTNAPFRVQVSPRLLRTDRTLRRAYVNNNNAHGLLTCRSC